MNEYEQKYHKLIAWLELELIRTRKQTKPNELMDIVTCAEINKLTEIIEKAKKI